MGLALFLYFRSYQAHFTDKGRFGCVVVESRVGVCLRHSCKRLILFILRTNFFAKMLAALTVTFWDYLKVILLVLVLVHFFYLLTGRTV